MTDDPRTAEQVARLITERLDEYAALAAQVASSTELTASVVRVGKDLVEVYRHGGRVLAFGNGGSAADAQHVVAEFVGRCTRERRPLPALALADNLAVVTAIGNDYGYDEVFARQIRAHARPGDLALAFSTSGRSPNVLRGLEAAQALGLRTVALTGADGGDLSADDVLRGPGHPLGPDPGGPHGVVPHLGGGRRDCVVRCLTATSPGTPCSSTVTGPSTSRRPSATSRARTTSS